MILVIIISTLEQKTSEENEPIILIFRKFLQKIITLFG